MLDKFESKKLRKKSIRDYIIASGDTNGVGIAVKQSDITLDQLHLVVGQAWEASEESDIKLVNVGIVLLDQPHLLLQKIERKKK